MSIVVATGVFELIHPGHILYLSEAKKLGDRLVVVVARDKTVEQKKRKPIIPEEQRLKVVRELKPVDEAVLGDEDDILKPIIKLRPDVIALGPNQDYDEKKLGELLKSRGLKTRVVRITEKYSSSLNSSKKIIDSIKSGGEGGT